MSRPPVTEGKSFVSQRRPRSSTSTLSPASLRRQADTEPPKPLPEYVRFYKVAKRRMDDISTVAAGLALDWNSAGRIARARFVFGGVAPVPLRVHAAEEAVIGERWNEPAVSRVQSILARTLKPISDHRGSSAYRLAVAQSLIEKFWWDRREVAA